MNLAQIRDIGAYLIASTGVTPRAITAGGAGDGTEIDGTTIDRQAQSRLYQSVAVLVPWTTTLQASETLSLAFNLQDAAASGGPWADFGTVVASTVVATGDSGGSTEVGVTKYDRDISGARRFLRVQLTPTLSASGTDTVTLAGVIVFGGPDRVPAA